MATVNRRDLITAGALGLLAPSLLARRAFGEASGQPVRYYGEILQVMFETQIDLTPLMPAGLRIVDRHRGFIKAERLKIRSHDADQRPVSFSHYQQVCISTLTEAGNFGQRHRNLLVWVDRPWWLGSTSVAKRYGEIEMTQIYEPDRVAVAQGEPVPFAIDVHAYGRQSLTFIGQLDGKRRAPAPPYGGFYVGGEPGAALKAMTLDSFALSRPLYGTGTLTFGAEPNEDPHALSPTGLWPATVLGDVRVEGCVFQELAFTRTYGAEFQTVR